MKYLKYPLNEYVSTFRVHGVLFKKRQNPLCPPVLLLIFPVIVVRQWDCLQVMTCLALYCRECAEAVTGAPVT